MPFDTHLKLTQLLLISLEEVSGASSDHIRVDIPLNRQLVADGLFMLKFALQVDTHLECIIPAGTLHASMTLTQMSFALDAALAVKEQAVA